MAREEKQKLKLYYLKKIMLEKTDEDHFITIPEIQEELAKYNIKSERKSIYRDLEELEDIGAQVQKVRIGRQHGYHVVKREFELAELKLLVDAIQSLKFITKQKSNNLIKKLESYASVYQASKLQRQVYVQGRIKTMNESIYSTVDAIHTAIEENKQIKFKYLQWNIKKQMEERRNGEWYQISPWALTWDDENYYLVAYDTKAGKIKHYRVDKMTKITVADEDRDGKKEFEKFDLAVYAKKNFRMYGGRDELVSVKIKNDKVGIFLDRFGTDISIFKLDAEYVEVKFHVALSGQFYGWIFALGDDVEIIGPSSVLSEIKKISKEFYNKYK